jgi:PadR family transcriptional regulator PadR
VANDLPGDWLRAVLSDCVLAVIGARGESYGYLVGKDIADAGLAEVTGGTLYPLLRRLETDGLVRSHWENADAGPSRKYYKVTARGRAHLDSVESDWAAFVKVVTRIITDRRSP